jgi:5-methylthioadenosine/S-adenosylhomocysteine deaminase
MPNRTVLKNGIVLSLDKQVGNFMHGDVLIDGTRIDAVGPNIKADDAEAVDASNMIVMPGFIDTHRHLWEGILRNIGTDIPLEGAQSYLAFILNTLAPVYRAEAVYAGNKVALWV